MPASVVKPLATVLTGYWTKKLNSHKTGENISEIRFSYLKTPEASMVSMNAVTLRTYCRLFLTFMVSDYLVLSTNFDSVFTFVFD